MVVVVVVAVAVTLDVPVLVVVVRIVTISVIIENDVAVLVTVAVLETTVMVLVDLIVVVVVVVVVVPLTVDVEMGRKQSHALDTILYANDARDLGALGYWRPRALTSSVPVVVVEALMVVMDPALCAFVVDAGVVEPAFCQVN